MKAVLHLMTLNYVDAGKRVVLGLCLFAIGICFVLQLTVLDGNPDARRSLFTVQVMMLIPLIVPWSLTYPRGVLASSWALMPWARLKFVVSTGLTTVLVAAATAAIHAVAVDSGGSATRLGACCAAFASTFTLISLLMLPLLGASASGPRQIVISMTATAGFVIAIVYSMARGMPLVSDPSLGPAVWLAFAGAVAAWVVGGARFATHSRSDHLRDTNPGPVDFFERLSASWLLRQGAAATLLKAHWNAAFRAPTLALLMLCAFIPMVRQPRGSDGFLAAMAFYGVLTAIRALVLGQATARQSRTLWMVRGHRDALLRECEAVLFRNVVAVAMIPGTVLLVGALLLQRSPSAVQLVIGYALAVFLPLLFACMGLLQMALPARAHWWAGRGGIALGALFFFSPAIFAITNSSTDSAGSLGVLTLVVLVLFLVCRRYTRRLWRNLDWTFLPAPPHDASKRVRN